MTYSRSAGLGPAALAPFQGPPQAPGPAGPNYGFGSITYEHLIAEPVAILDAGRSILVRVNDWGPHRRLGRLIDLSTGSCRALSACGLARVRVEVVPPVGASRNRFAGRR